MISMTLTDTFLHLNIHDIEFQLFNSFQIKSQITRFNGISLIEINHSFLSSYEKIMISIKRGQQNVMRKVMRHFISPMLTLCVLYDLYDINGYIFKFKYS